MFIQARYAAVVLPLFLLAGCEDWDVSGLGDHYREDFHYSYPLNAGASVEVDNSNGAVEISGWDKNTVDIDGTKYAGSEDRLRTVRVDISHSSNSISIRTFMPAGWHGNAGARYTIHVPRHVELENIGTSNGPIRVDNIEGTVRLKTSNGNVHASGIRGLLDAHSSNGTLEVADLIGDATLHTSNGGIRADIRKGAFEATTTNGSITARLMESDSHPVRLESSNGRIDLTMDAVREVHAGTSNSSITVRMPGSVGANVRAHTTNSSIDSDFDVSIHGGMLSKHSLEGTIGPGGPLLDLGTSNGSIKILRL
jgi:DUF4097 and DUF4098 domain-containing protein YvlB